MEDILTKKNPFKPEKCTVKLCPLCSDPKNDLKIPCNTNNIGYRWTCQNCEDLNKVKVYEGESARAGRVRGIEHIRGLKNENNDNVLYKHKILEHGDKEHVKFKMEVTRVFKDALTRQANEAVRISSRPNSELLNSKNQFQHPPIARVIIEKRNKYENKDKRAKLGPGL